MKLKQIFFLNLMILPISASSFSTSKILLAETLYCFPPVSIIANDISYLFINVGQYSLKKYQVKIIEAKNYLLNHVI